MRTSYLRRTPKAVARSDRVEPEAEAGREQLGLPALLHVLDHDGAAARPLHINARLRLRPPRRRPLQEDRHGQHSPPFSCNSPIDTQYAIVYLIPYETSAVSGPRHEPGAGVGRTSRAGQLLVRPICGKGSHTSRIFC